MAKYLIFNVARSTLVLTEQELMSLLKQDHNLWATALKRGKTFKRSAQTKDRVRKKVEREMGRDPPI
jgi:hypothetical protein